MLVVTVELLHRTIRAASADDLAMVEGADLGDWPPNPARLFSALVAGDGTGARCQVTDGSELMLLERARPPRIYASPRAEVLQSPISSRYAVENEQAAGSVQEYPGRKSLAVRPGTRLAPRLASIAYVWDDVEPTDREFGGLELRAARVGYLGCSDTPVRTRVGTELPLAFERDLLWEPDEAGQTALPVPFSGLLGILDDMYERFRGGEPVRRSWFPSRRVAYRGPRERRWASPAWSGVEWLRFDHAIAGRHILRVTETLKAAILDLHERHVGTVPPILHGHGFEGTGCYHLAHWLALPEAGHEHARGRLHGAAIALPRDAPREVVAGIREALFHLRELVLPGRPPLAVGRHAGEERPWSSNPRRWQGPARRWVSVSPVVHERRAKGGLDIEEVSRWCRHAGIDALVLAFRTSGSPMLPGALTLRGLEVFRRPEGRRPFSHLEILFAEPVRGPLALGRARQFGVGLMAPVSGGEPAR